MPFRALPSRLSLRPYDCHRQGVQRHPSSAARPHPRAAARTLPVDATDPDARGAPGQPLPPDQGGRADSSVRSARKACAVGSAYALEPRDILSPLIRNLGSMLVKGATPVEVLRQYMAKADSMTRGRELNIHIGDLERGFVGQISHLGDMVPVMAGHHPVVQDPRRAARRAWCTSATARRRPAPSTRGSTSPPCSAARWW